MRGERGEREGGDMGRDEREEGREREREGGGQAWSSQAGTWTQSRTATTSSTGCVLFFLQKRHIRGGKETY